MELVTKWLKTLAMELTFLLAGLLTVLFKKRKPDFSGRFSIAVLFLKPLGFGDLIMLSPAIQILPKLFENSQIYLITRTPKIIQFDGIKWLNQKQASEMKFDMVLSPSLNLRHFFYLFRFRPQYWLGYFAKPKLQSNFVADSLEYNPKTEHYLERGLNLIKLLEEKTGRLFEKQIKARKVFYPSLVLERPEQFQQLKARKYAIVAPFSMWPERQWPLGYFAQVINHIIKQGIVRKVIITGGKSGWEEEKEKELLSKIKEKEKVLSFIGENCLNLPETSFLIKKALFYLGLDSGPSHLAYLLAKRSAVIFVSVAPETRIPLSEEKRETIITFYPRHCPDFPCYSGLYRPEFKKCRKCAQTIKPKDVLQKISRILL